LYVFVVYHLLEFFKKKSEENKKKIVRLASALMADANSSASWKQVMGVW